MPQRLFQKLFRKKQQDFSGEFAEFSRSLTLIIDIEQLKDNVIAKIRELISVDTILIYLINADLNRQELAESRGFEPDPDRKYHLFPDDPLCRWFTVNNRYLLIPGNSSVFDYFNEREQTILAEAGVDLIFPLFVMNRVIGLVCLGPKRDGESFSGEEIELLNTLLRQAAFAFENAYLYRQQNARIKKMYRADRLATIGQIAAGAAHEIRNPLTSIRSSIQYIQKDLENERSRTLVTEVIKEVDRINAIIEGLLSFSKPGSLHFEKVALEKLFRDTLQLVSTTANKNNINIELVCNARSQDIVADSSQLKQVFLNIIMNGIQAMCDGGDLRITIDEKRRGNETMQNGDMFHIEFLDTGPGIPRENMEHLFDPFFTTKANGTGLGLSISYGIVHKHGGEIEIDSRTGDEDHGTRVTISLPLTQ